MGGPSAALAERRGVVMHRHRWEVVHRYDQPSAVQQMKEAGMTDWSGPPCYVPLMFEIPVIVTYRCSCGAGEGRACLMGAHSWPEEFMVFGPFPWEELLVEEHSMKTEAAQAEPEGRREIPSALARLDLEMGGLFESIDSLSERLGPVLRSEDVERAETAAPRQLLSTDLGRSIDGWSLSIESAAARLRALRDRVEL